MRTTNDITSKRHVQAWISDEQYYKLEQLARVKATKENRAVPLAELVREGVRRMIEKGEK